MTTMTSDHAANDDFEISDPSRLPAKPLVSVLMLAYNHGVYLADAIEGVLKQQTDFPIELLIGEDSSTDNTREIAMCYQRAHPDMIRVIASARNVGGSHNGQRVTRAARGEFIALCEGDDYWIDPAKLQLQVDYLRAHPDAGAVHSDFNRIISRAGQWRTLPRFQQRTRGSIPQGDIFPILLAGNFIQTCTLCIRTDLGRQYLSSDLPTDSYPVGDWPLCLYIAAQSKIGYLDWPLAVYRKVPGSAMNSGHAARARTVTGYVPMVEDFCDQFAVDAATRTKALASNYQVLFSFAVFADDMALFERARTWLALNDAAYLRPWRRRLLPWLARSPAMRRVLTRFYEARVALGELRHYR